MRIETGKAYEDGNGDVWANAQGKTSAMHQLFTLTRLTDGAVCTFKIDGTFRPEGRNRTALDDLVDLRGEYGADRGPTLADLKGERIPWYYAPGDKRPTISKPAVPTVEQIDLVVAYREDRLITLNLTVAGRTQKYTISRTAAASMIGRVAEAIST